MTLAAIVYDFDGTLAPGNMQDQGLLARLGLAPDEFWAEVMDRRQENDADQILSYLGLLVEKGRNAKPPLTRDMLRECGAALRLFDGVEAWFTKINAFAKSVGLELEHYVISAGNREIIEGCSIYDQFKNVFACRFAFDEQGGAHWPLVAINYTTKTQFLFRINKGIDDTWDDTKINSWMPEDDRRVSFRRMIFIGDGDTDIPSFKTVTEHGGASIGVFDPAEWADAEHRKKAHKLIAESRVDFVAPADYHDESQLAVVVRGILDRIARAERVHPEFFKNGVFQQEPAKKPPRR